MQCSERALTQGDLSLRGDRGPCEYLATSSVSRAIDYVPLVPAQPMVVCADHSARMRESGDAVYSWNVPSQRTYSEVLSNL